MHDILVVKVSHCFADIPEITFNVAFTYGFHFDLLEESSSIRVLEYHISDFSLGVDVNIDELDDFGMG